jgi:DNA-binding response OmpR family regulator
VTPLDSTKEVPPDAGPRGRGATVGAVNADVRLLVVEDDPAVAEALSEGLRRDGYQVHVEGSVAGALAHARSAHPHLAVLDVRLPDGSGFDICRELRRGGLKLPILMLTVQADEIDQVTGLEAGADDYVAKPYRLRELLARIRALLRRAYGDLSTGAADLLYAGDLVIDRSSGRVTRGERTIDLTPTEFRLLMFLAQHPGQVLSRDQLLESVWGYSADSIDEKTVNVHVRRLRTKIEPNPDEPTLLLTVPGLGYRLAR